MNARGGQRSPNRAAEDTLAAARRMMAEQFDIVRATEVGVVAGEVEPLHDMRVALRRLRTLLRTFGKACKLPGADRLERRLDRLQKALGPARDADVLIAILESRAVARLLNSLDAREQIIATQKKRRKDRKAAVQALLAGATHRRLKRDTARWLQTTTSTGRSVPPLRRIAAEAVQKALARVRKRSEMPAACPATAVHRLRIACRRARYLCEFFGAGPGDDLAQLALKFKAVQDVLGDVHDLDVLIVELNREHIAVPPALVGELGKRRQRLIRRFVKEWDRLQKSTS